MHGLLKMDGLEQGGVKVGDMLRSQCLQSGHDCLEVLAELANLHTPAGLRPGQQPFAAALEDFEGAKVVVLLDMQVDYSHLQDTAIQVAHRAGFGPPGCFKRFVGFEIAPQVEQFHPMDGLRMERTLAIGIFRHIQIGYIKWNYIISKTGET